MQLSVLLINGTGLMYFQNLYLNMFLTFSYENLFLQLNMQQISYPEALQLIEKQYWTNISGISLQIVSIKVIIFATVVFQCQYFHSKANI